MRSILRQWKKCKNTVMAIWKRTKSHKGRRLKNTKYKEQFLKDMFHEARLIDAVWMVVLYAITHAAFGSHPS